MLFRSLKRILSKDLDEQYTPMVSKGIDSIATEFTETLNVAHEMIPRRDCSKKPIEDVMSRLNNMTQSFMLTRGR